MAIKVAVNGALGRMGKEVVRAVLKEPEIELVAAIDLKGSGGDIGPAVGLEPLQVNVAQDLNRVL
ncbi:MAG TPA: 4-hydroxy-tetrahydrodipicolinate reductase, partial [Firmicutes bacterium]|nr:4-hydroxy-tetrahydrodipicolinate reductase [Bacillota bacterium]